MDFEENKGHKSGGEDEQVKVGTLNVRMSQLWWTYHPRFLLCNVENQMNNMTQMNSQDSKIVDPRMLRSLKEKWVFYSWPCNSVFECIGHL
jgi:hypothetical protein